jgi:hypothetical protein
MKKERSLKNVIVGSIKRGGGGDGMKSKKVLVEVGSFLPIGS